MAIQNSINQALGAIAGATALGVHTVDAEQKKQAEIVETREQLASTKKAYKNDTIEAAIAIRAHNDKFDPQIGDKKMSEYVKKNDKGETVQDNDALSKALEALDEKGIEDLAQKVEEERTGQMTTDRVANMDKWGAEAKELPDLEEKNREARRVADPLTLKGGRNAIYQRMTGGFTRKQMAKKIHDAQMANKYLKKSYESFRELNNRIAASRELKFDIKAATEKLKRLGGKE